MCRAGKREDPHQTETQRARTRTVDAKGMAVRVHHQRNLLHLEKIGAGGGKAVLGMCRLEKPLQTALDIKI